MPADRIKVSRKSLPSRKTFGRRSSSLDALRWPLDDRREAHSESDAERREAVVELLPLHLVEHRRDQPGAAHAEWVTQRNRPAIDVQLRVLEADRVPGRNRDGGEGLVDLPD